MSGTLKKKFLLLPLVLCLFNCRDSFAAADFYGVKMMSEYFVKDLAVDESQNTPRFKEEKPGMDSRVYAYATLAGKSLKIQVFNRSDETIKSAYDYLEYLVLTRSGERIHLKPQSMAWGANDRIAPNKSATFEPSFAGRPLKKEEIRAIICSFDLGDMKIILLPLAKKYGGLVPQGAKVVAPPVSVTLPTKPVIKEIPKPAVKKTENKKPEAQLKPKIAPKPVPPVKKAAPPKVEKKVIPAPPKKVASAPAPKEKKLAYSAENETKTLERYEKNKQPRKYWRVEEIQKDYLVINLGAHDGLKAGASVQIARDGVFMAQATVRQVSENYSTVSPPADASANIKTGDDVLFFGTAP